MKTVGQTLLLLLFYLLSFSMAQAGNESDEFKSLLERAELLRSSDPREFAEVIQRLDSLSASATLKERQHLQLLHAYEEGFQGRFNASVELSQDLYEKAVDPTIRLRASLLIANTSAATRSFSSGLNHLEAALSASSAKDFDTYLRAQVLGVATLVYNQFDKHELSRHYASQLLELDIDPRTRCIGMQQRLTSLQGLGEWPVNESEFTDALAQCKAAGEGVFVNFLYADLARHLASIGDTDGAESLLSEHLVDAREAGYPRLTSQFHSLLSRFRLQKGDLDGAERHAHAALEVDAGSSASIPKVEALKVLYEAAERRNDTGKALRYFRQYAEADKSYLDDVMVRELAFQQSRNEVQQKDQAISLLSKQNEVLKLEQTVARKSAQNTRLFVLLLAVVLAAIGYWAYKIKRMQTRFRILAQTDGLTGIYNRRHFRSEAESLLKDCQASGKHAALVLLDLDNFKYINDQHGHAAGDWVLQQVADACHAACREGDLCGRLGGEEFGILSCGADAGAAERIAQRCRELFASIDMGLIKHSHPITASFGCTTTAVSGYGFEAMFANADEAMYIAKNSGRDQVQMHVRTGESAGSTMATQV